MNCPACDSSEIELWRKWAAHRIFSCQNCSLTFLDEACAGDSQEYDLEYYRHWEMTFFAEDVWRMKIQSCLTYLRLIGKRATLGTRLLDVGCAYGFMLEAARQIGVSACGQDISPAIKIARNLGFIVFEGELENVPYATDSFDAITMVDVLEHFKFPRRQLLVARHLLKKDGVLFIVTPDFGSVSRKILGQRWFHLKTEHLYYYSRQSLTNMLEKTGFKPVYFSGGLKYLTYRYILAHFERYSHGIPAALFSTFRRILPLRMQSVPIRFQTEMICIAIKA